MCLERVGTRQGQQSLHLLRPNCSGVAADGVSLRCVLCLKYTMGPPAAALRPRPRLCAQQCLATRVVLSANKETKRKNPYSRREGAPAARDSLQYRLYDHQGVCLLVCSRERDTANPPLAAGGLLTLAAL